VRSRIPMWTGAGRAVRLLLPNFLRQHTRFTNVREVDSISDVGGGFSRYLVTTWSQRNDAPASRSARRVAMGLLVDSIYVLAAAVHTRGGCWLVDLQSVVFRGGVGVGAWVSISERKAPFSHALFTLVSVP
jgi:hypothetical protein